MSTSTCKQVRDAAVPPFPLYIRIENARVVVVGAGHVAVRKVESLLEYGADVTVIAPEAAEEISDWAQRGLINLQLRPYEQGDIEGALLVVAATSDRELNTAIYDEACSNNTLVNVVDIPELCNCIVPSILRRGRMQIAVSTDGAAPGVARDVRRELERQFPDWWGSYIDLMAATRALVKERVPEGASARTPLFEALNCAELRERIAAGEQLSAEEAYTFCVTPLLGGENA